MVYNTTTAPGTYSGEIVIPESVTYNNITYPVTAIGYNAFGNSTGLTSVTIPASITSFGTSAFSGCTALAEVIYNATSLNDLFSGPFSASTAENFTVSVGNNVTKLPNYIFAGLTHLTTVCIPASVESIGNYAFQGCTGLTTLPMGSGVTIIGNYAYKGCTGITTITIPSHVTSIGTNAFENCTGLTEINYNVTTHSDFTSTTKPFKGCSSGSSFNITLNIGFNVEKIPAHVFNGAKVAGDVVIPCSVSTIGDYAFTNNGGSYTSITTVYMLSATPPTLANIDIFKTGYNAYNCNIKVLYSSDKSILNAYKEATNWSTYSNTISETDNFTVTNMDLTGITTPVTIPAGNTITVTGTVTNPTAANLIIADGGQLICNNPVNATLQKEITAAEVWGEPGADAWYFIASPVDGYETSNVIITGITDTDLYSFDEESGYWFNGQGTDHPFTTLTRGQGYLYANSTGNDLSFLGTMPATNTTIEKPLSFAGSGSSKGFNLMGNPFTCNLTSDNVKIQDGETQTSITTYYIVEDGTELATMNLSTDQIKPGRGFLIQADKGGQKLVFNPAAKRNETKVKPSFIRIEAGNADFMDRAYVQIGQGNTLRKMTINDNVSHVYVMSEGKDYAAATIQEAQGEMPVNFKAAKNGQYTITVNPENVEMDYLHLVDNLTGADIDLLSTPSYTFNAKTTDYASRFRLLFAANGIEENGTSTSSANFAFISNGQLIVNGTGTLQIIDMTGRVVSTKSTEERISTNELTPGVYVVKLIGNETKTQKIVIE